MWMSILIFIVGIFVGIFIGIGGAIWMFKKQIKNFNPNNMMDGVMSKMFGPRDEE